MATQAEVDALTGKVADVGAQLTKGLGEVTNEIAALKDAAANAQPPLDLSALEAKVDEAKAVAQSLDDVVPDTVSVDPTSPGEPPVDEVPVETPSEPTVSDEV